MPNKKLTDKEIVKAFEMHLLDNRDCELCPYGTAHYRCDIELLKNALDLIKRLQAENERLKIQIENLESVQEISPEVKHFVDTKADKVISLLNEVIKSQEQIKAESYQEFAEAVKQDFDNPNIQKYGLDYVNFLKGIVDRRLEKLVGEDK